MRRAGLQDYTGPCGHTQFPTLSPPLLSWCLRCPGGLGSFFQTKTLPPSGSSFRNKIKLFLHSHLPPTQWTSPKCITWGCLLGIATSYLSRYLPACPAHPCTLHCSLYARSPWSTGEGLSYSIGPWTWCGISCVNGPARALADQEISRHWWRNEKQETSQSTKDILKLVSDIASSI